MRKCKDCNYVTCPDRDNSTAGEKECPYGIGQIISVNSEGQYWKDFRNQVAKDLLCSFASREAIGYDSVKNATIYANLLVRQLKESE